MSNIRYLLDENMSRAVRNQLHRREPKMEVLCIGDGIAPPLATPDPVILRWIEQNGYILVSRNRRTMPVHLQEHLAMDRHIPGILLLKRWCAIAQLLDDLLLIWEAAKPDEYRDRIEYLPL